MTGHTTVGRRTSINLLNFYFLFIFKSRNHHDRCKGHESSVHTNHRRHDLPRKGYRSGEDSDVFQDLSRLDVFQKTEVSLKRVPEGTMDLRSRTGPMDHRHTGTLPVGWRHFESEG